MEKSKRIVAVIVAYWPQRYENVRRIVRDLQNSTRPPDNIIILNNNSKHTLKVEGAYVINSEYNFRCRAKMLVALMDVADYYLLLDDDTTVNPKTIENFLTVAHEDCAYGFCGVTYLGGNGKRILPENIEIETETEYFLGCGLFLSFRAIVNMLRAEEEVRVKTKWKHEGEDILVGLVNHSTIIPMPENEGFITLPWGDEAMAFGSDGVTKGQLDYLRMRDEFTLDCMNILKKGRRMKYYSKALQLKDYNEFDEHTYFSYLKASWTGKVPFRFEHDQRIWEYGLALKAIKDNKVSKVLDVGGGSSLLSPGLAELGYDVTQVNLDDEPFYVLAQEKFIDKTLEYIHGDFMEYSARKKYDAVLCISVIEHVENDEEFFLKLLKSVKKNGILVLTTDFHESGKALSASHRRTYNKEKMNHFIKLAKEKGFKLWAGDANYDEYDNVVYDYTFCSLILKKE